MSIGVNVASSCVVLLRIVWVFGWRLSHKFAQYFFEPCKYIICGKNIQRQKDSNERIITQGCMTTRYHVLGKGKTDEIQYDIK